VFRLNHYFHSGIIPLDLQKLPPTHTKPVSQVSAQLVKISYANHLKIIDNAFDYNTQIAY